MRKQLITCIEMSRRIEMSVYLIVVYRIVVYRIVVYRNVGIPYIGHRKSTNGS